MRQRKQSRSDRDGFLDKFLANLTARGVIESAKEFYKALTE